MNDNIQVSLGQVLYNFTLATPNSIWAKLNSGYFVVVEDATKVWIVLTSSQPIEWYSNNPIVVGKKLKAVREEQRDERILRERAEYYARSNRNW